MNIKQSVTLRFELSEVTLIRTYTCLFDLLCITIPAENLHNYPPFVIIRNPYMVSNNNGKYLVMGLDCDGTRQVV